MISINFFSLPEKHRSEDQDGPSIGKQNGEDFSPSAGSVPDPESLKFAEYEDEYPGSENANGEQNEESFDDNDTSISKSRKDQESENSLHSPPY